jgi:hypothetical protein
MLFILKKPKEKKENKNRTHPEKDRGRKIGVSGPVRGASHAKKQDNEEKGNNPDD